MTSSPAVLLVGLVPGHGGMHLPRYLARNGLRTAFLGTGAAVASKSSHLQARFEWQANGRPYSFAPLVTAVKRMRPARIVPLDELAVLRLEEVGRGALAGGSASFPAELVAVVRASLGDPRGYLHGRRRNGIAVVASSAGIEAPAQVTVERTEDVVEFAQRQGYPVVLKRELSMGGAGVFILADEEAARREGAAQLAGGGGTRWIVQSYVPGELGMHAVLAQEGRVVAGVSGVQLCRRSASPTSPSSVVRLCNHPGMAQASARHVREAQLSGFHAWDFILRDGAAPVMIEHNPRPIAISCLGGLVGNDLCAALSRSLGGQPRVPPSGKVGDEVDVALFPEEWFRDPSSERLQSGFHDAPWDDPPLFDAALKAGRFR